MKAFWKYTLARFVIFAASYVLVWGITRFWFESSQILNLWVLLIALVLSSIISVVALAPLRDQLALKLQDRAHALNDRIEESRRAEDVD